MNVSRRKRAHCNRSGRISQTGPHLIGRTSLIGVMRVIAGSDLLMNLHVRAYSAHAYAQDWKACGRNGKHIVLRRVPKAAAAPRGTAARRRPARATAPPQEISQRRGDHAVQENDCGFHEMPKTKNISTCAMSRRGHRDPAAAEGPPESAGAQLRHKGTGRSWVPMALCELIVPYGHAPHSPMSYPLA